MGRAISKLNSGKLHRSGIGHLANVARGVVTGMPVDGLRFLETARSLLVRLTWRQAAGPLTGPKYGLQPVAAGAMWKPEPTSSGRSRSCQHGRLGRLRSAIRFGRF